MPRSDRTDLVQYCSSEEYSSGERSRIMGSDLSIGGLYMVMFSLEGIKSNPNPGKDTAGKCAGRVINVKALLENERWHMVGLDLLDDDLRYFTFMAAVFRDGYMMTENVPDDLTKVGYLMEHDDGVTIPANFVVAGQ